MDAFLTNKRLLHGPWQAFERDVARLLLHNNFSDVRVVGKSGDHGADVLAENSNGLWVIQCKHTTNSYPPKDAIDEVVNAAKYYQAQNLVVASSRPAGDAFLRRRDEFKRSGLNIKTWGPQQLTQLFERGSEHVTSKNPLRDYQEDAAELFYESLTSTGVGQIVLATGLGKTTVMASTVQMLFENKALKHNRVLVLAHMKELINQLHFSFWNQLSKRIPTHQLSDGEYPISWTGVTFATFQSIFNNLDSLPQFDLILVDEAHHIGAETYRSAVLSMSPDMLGGVTATPWRGDNFSIDDIFGPPVFKLGIAEGLAKGFLSEVKYKLLADNIDWTYVQEQSKKNYSIKQLNKRLLIPTRDEKAARLIRTNFLNENRKSGIIFCPSVIHARHLSGFLRESGFSCEIIASEIEPRERAKNMTNFRRGRLDLVLTVDMFNEGVDVPDVDLIVFMRSTHSRRIFIQQLGRGLRVSKNKRNVLVLDFVSDIRRMAEVIELDSAVKSFEVEKVGLGKNLLEFSDESAGTFMNEWILDQADLINNDSPILQLPELDFPRPPNPGNTE